jgi:hypothetical protein
MGSVTHAAGAVLVADPFQGDALLEIGVQRDGGRRVAGLLEYVDPAVLEPIERFNIVWRVRKLNSLGR